MIKSTLIRPLAGQIVVAKTGEVETVKGGIILPQRTIDAAKKESMEATVLAVGRDVSDLLKFGVKVLVSKYGGTEFRQNGTSYLIVKEKDALAILT